MLNAEVRSSSTRISAPASSSLSQQPFVWAAHRQITDVESHHRTAQCVRRSHEALALAEPVQGYLGDTPDAAILLAELDLQALDQTLERNVFGLSGLAASEAHLVMAQQAQETGRMLADLQAKIEKQQILIDGHEELLQEYGARIDSLSDVHADVLWLQQRVNDMHHDLLEQRPMVPPNDPRNEPGLGPLKEQRIETRKILKLRAPDKDRGTGPQIDTPAQLLGLTSNRVQPQGHPCKPAPIPAIKSDSDFYTRTMAGYGQSQDLWRDPRKRSAARLDLTSHDLKPEGSPKRLRASSEMGEGNSDSGGIYLRGGIGSNGEDEADEDTASVLIDLRVMERIVFLDPGQIAHPWTLQPHELKERLRPRTANDRPTLGAIRRHLMTDWEDKFAGRLRSALKFDRKGDPACIQQRARRLKSRWNQPGERCVDCQENGQYCLIPVGSPAHGLYVLLN